MDRQASIPRKPLVRVREELLADLLPMIQNALDDIHSLFSLLPIQRTRMNLSPLTEVHAIQSSFSVMVRAAVNGARQ